MSPPAIASIHDVTPATLDDVMRLRSLLARSEAPPPTLLVVAGMEWDDTSLSTLRALAEEGCELAGHGWSHQSAPRTLYHQLHAQILSRDQAEHLSRSRNEVQALVQRCYDWFGEVGLPTPRLYVPPAWAMGPLRARDVRTLPFLWYETLTGYLDARSGRRTRVPLIGFEADTALRALGLRMSNAVNRAASRLTRRPLRVALHPHDLDLLLEEDLRRAAARRETWETEVGLLAGPGDPT